MLRSSFINSRILRCLSRTPFRRAFSTAHGCAPFGASTAEISETRQVLNSIVRRREDSDERGQAMIEFIMLIPLLMAFVWYMVHVNMAINKSIVGQKHVRSQLFSKLFNHRSGPVLSDFGKSDRSHFYIGVSSEPTAETSSVTAPTEMLGIGLNPDLNPAANDDGGEAEIGSLRQRVRIRTVFGICTHRKTLPDRTGLTDFCGSVPAGR